MEKKQIINYRGIKTAFLVGVLEGDGTTERPYAVTDYVLVPNTRGQMITYGKVVKLDSDEKGFIGSEEIPSQPTN